MLTLRHRHCSTSTLHEKEVERTQVARYGAQALPDENMSTAGGDHPFDTMDEFRHEGWVFLCSAEQLPDGSFHASVRYRMPPTNEIRTLQYDQQRFSSAVEAVLRARELAVLWAANRSGDGRGQG